MDKLIVGATALEVAKLGLKMGDGIASYSKNLLKGINSLVPSNSDEPLVCARPAVAVLDKYKARIVCEILTGYGFRKFDKKYYEYKLFHATDNYIPRLKNINVLATLHDPVPLLHPEWMSNWGRGEKYIFTKIIDWADRYISISNAIVPELVDCFGLKSKKITCIYHGVDDCYFDKKPFSNVQILLNQYGLITGFYLLIATLQPRKNIARILQAFLALPLAMQQAHPLVIVGRNGWGVDDEVALIRQLQSQGRAVWLQGVNDDEKRCLLQSALALVFPSLYEGFGLPILEAFASGLPVITSNVSAMPEVAGDAALLVNPLDVEDIAHAMQRIAESPTLCFELSEKGRARAREFTWKKTAEQTMAVYREMM